MNMRSRNTLGTITSTSKTVCGTVATALLLGSLGGCGGGTVKAPQATPPPASFSASITVQLPPAGTGTPANQNLLGSNLEWTNNGDNMLLPGTLNFDGGFVPLESRNGFSGVPWVRPGCGKSTVGTDCEYGDAGISDALPNHRRHTDDHSQRNHRDR
jgi:hypothetical protein